MTHPLIVCSISSYDTREENTGVGPGDALRDIQEYITGAGDDDNNTDGQNEIESLLLDNDSAHEDESQHKAFVRRRTMTVRTSSISARYHSRAFLKKFKIDCLPVMPSITLIEGLVEPEAFKTKSKQKWASGLASGLLPGRAFLHLCSKDIRHSESGLLSQAKLTVLLGEDAIGKERAAEERSSVQGCSHCRPSRYMPVASALYRTCPLSVLCSPRHVIIESLDLSRYKASVYLTHIEICIPNISNGSNHYCSYTFNIQGRQLRPIR